jgi:Cu/Zn superoxide dismutase
MRNRGWTMSVVVAAACLLAMAGCGDDSGDDDDGGGAGTSGSSGGGSGAGGSSGGGGSSGAAGGSAGSGGRSGAGGGAGTAGNTGGSGGASGASGSAGGDDDAGMDSEDSGQGGDDPTAVATIAGFDGGSVTGTFTFTQDGGDVTLVVALENCPDGAHQVHIHEGTGCADETAQGMHWGPARGEGIPDVQCTGGEGTVMHTRSSTPANLAWSIGGNANSDIVGHAVVVHATGSTDRIGCGVIVEQ